MQQYFSSRARIYIGRQASGASGGGGSPGTFGRRDSHRRYASRTGGLRAVAGVVSAGVSGSFSIAPSAGHAAGAVSITATYAGAISAASNPFTIVSGPASSITGYVQVNSSTATFTLNVSAVSSTLIVISDSVTGTTKTYNPAAVVPGAPTGVSATAGNAQATVAFSAPADNGGTAITSYLVIGAPGGSQSGAASPIIVTGLANGVAHTFTVRATNSVGIGPASAASGAVTPSAGGPTYHRASRVYRVPKISRRFMVPKPTAA